MAELNNNIINPDLIDLAFRELGIGSYGSSTASIFRGLNVIGGLPPLPPNTDNQGYTFFTRPQMNMAKANIERVRQLIAFTNKDVNSMGNVIRCMLNPIGFDKEGDTYRATELVDDENVFLPLLSNTIITLSGFPDVVAQTYTSDAGIGGEQVAFVDGRPDTLGVVTLTATFANMEGDPVSVLFNAWVEYSNNVAQGSILPFPINNVTTRVDYQTRIWRLVMDKNKKYIQGLYCAPVAFPFTNPKGAKANLVDKQHFSSTGGQITIQFMSSGIIYDDPILVEEFNIQVAMFNPDMLTKSGMVKLDGFTKEGFDKRTLGNYKSYPWITESWELEWWMKESEWQKIDKLISSVKDPKDAQDKQQNKPESIWKDSLIDETQPATNSVGTKK